MKLLVVKFLLCLFALSFLGDAGINFFPNKEKIETNEDAENEQEAPIKSKKHSIMLPSLGLALNKQAVVGYNSLLPDPSTSQMTYEAEFRPPRA